MIQIIPSILTSDKHELADLLERAMDASIVHIDVIDSKFADNTTITPEDLKGLHPKPLIEFHLMTIDPNNWVERCVRANAHRIIGHIEHMNNQQEFVKMVTGSGVKAGLAVDIDTPVESLDQSLFPDLDCVLIMSVPAGFGGQRFNLKALDKMKILKKIKDQNNYEFNISDDGGVTIHLIDDAHYVGANEVVIGRALFDGDVVENIARYQKAAHLLHLNNN